MQDAKYQQVMAWVKQNIENGSFQSGDKLESEKELSERFGLSRQTIRHATGELAREGLVTRVRGSGTYIGTDLSDPEMQESVRERKMNIAVISTFSESYIFPQTLKGIERVLSKSGYAMQVSFTDNRLYREEAILQQILEKDAIDGVIVEPAKSALPNPNLRYYRALQERRVPILFFNAVYPELDAPCVRIDDVGAAKKATRYLIEAGHRQIGGIFKTDDRQGPLRYQGYLEAMLEQGYRTSQHQVLWIDTPETSSLEDIGDYIFKRLSDCTGVLCYNDQVAYQMIEMAKKRGIRVPADLSIIGIDDDSYMASVSRVPLTSFAHPKETLGRKVAENMIKMIEDPGYDGNYLFDSEAVIRKSVSIPRTA